MEGENGKEPHEVKGGFYSKRPIQRILVAAAGPFVNIVFADSPPPCSSDMFSCRYHNAIPVSIHYRQLNFSSDTKVSIQYHPKSKG